MPLYSISTGVPTLDTTLTSLTLGYGPNQTAPPDLLIYNGASGTVTLPAINPTLPSPPTTPSTTPGVGDGFTMTIRNQAGNTITVTPAGSDALENVFLGGIGAQVKLQASAADKKWYNVTGTNGLAGGGGSRSVAGAATIATTDRYLIDSTASAITLPAPSNFPTGAPFVTVINTSVGNLTVTPASGNIQGVAALTIATLKSATLLTDGTNFFLAAS